MTASTMTNPTVAATCSCNHGAIWHIGNGRCVVTQCRCARLYRPSRFEQMTKAEQDAHLDAAFGPDVDLHPAVDGGGFA